MRDFGEALLPVVEDCDHPRRYFGITLGLGVEEICGVCKHERWSPVEDWGASDDDLVPVSWSDWAYRGNPGSRD